MRNVVYFEFMDRVKQIRIPHPLPKNTQPHPWLGVFYLVGIRTHLNADVRWTSAATSSKTGGFFDFYPLLRVKMLSNPSSSAKNADTHLGICFLVPASICGARNFSFATCSRNFDRCTRCALPSSATGGGRARGRTLTIGSRTPLLASKNPDPIGGRDFLVPATGLEPVRFLRRGILSPLCLPISPCRHGVCPDIVSHI